MNERIKLLAEQAIIGKYWDKENSRWVEQHVDLEKFAQMIVNECAGIYDAINNGNLISDTDNYFEALRKTFQS